MTTPTMNVRPRRRGSLVGPLLLIAIGGLLLARNIYPDLRLMDWVARYWPYVLIAWGALRAIEILIWAGQSKPLPSRGITGGEWVLAVFIVLFGSSTHAIHGFTQGLSPGWPGTINWGGLEVFGQRFDYPVSEERPTSKTPRVILENFKGDVQVRGMDTDRVKVTGQMTIRAMDQGTADNAARGTPLEFTGDANRLVIRMIKDDLGPMRAALSVEVTVPKGASVEFEGRSADLRVTSVDGSVNLKGRGSDIELRDIGGLVSINGSYNGTLLFQKISKPLRMELARTQLSVEQIPGEIRMASGDLRATDVVGPLRLNARSRDVRIDNFSNTVEVSVERGDVFLRPGQLPLSRIKAQSRSGDIRLALPSSAQFSIRATTEHGDITNELDGALRLDSKGQQGTLSGALGNGPEIDLETRRGDISIRKAEQMSQSFKGPAPAEKIQQRPGQSVEQRIERTIEQKLEQLQKLEQ